MFNKILFWLGLALTAILIIENMVLSNASYLFIDRSSQSWIVALVANIIWIAMWYWIAWMLKKWFDNNDDDDLDF